MISTTYVERQRKAPTETYYDGQAQQTVPTENRFERDTKQVMTIAKAAESNMWTVDLGDSAGQVSGEYIYLYPPGIPLVVPGEQITEKLIAHIQDMQRKGLEIQGLRDYTGKKVDVCRKV